MKMLHDSVNTGCKNVKNQDKANSKKSVLGKLVWFLQSPVRVQDEVTRLQAALAELDKRVKP